jgi:hypothetical protein
MKLDPETIDISIEELEKVADGAAIKPSATTITVS